MWSPRHKSLSLTDFQMTNNNTEQRERKRVGVRGGGYLGSSVYIQHGLLISTSQIVHKLTHFKTLLWHLFNSRLALHHSFPPLVGCRCINCSLLFLCYFFRGILLMLWSTQPCWMAACQSVCQPLCFHWRVVFTLADINHSRHSHSNFEVIIALKAEHRNQDWSAW